MKEFASPRTNTELTDAKLSPTLALACQLIARPSVTPEDKGCQPLIAERLSRLGFQAEPMPFEDAQGAVDNLWLRLGTQAPLFVFAGHTDVVPAGPLEQWTFPPFEPRIHQGYLYGRGAADMKGAVAAMVTAVERYLSQHPDHPGSIALLLTSDEEGPATCGTARVIEALQQRGESIDWCLVGEPSSEQQLGDQIRNGRRGSLSATITVEGIQGHVAYPHLASNPIHAAAPALAELASTCWDQGNAFFPPTSFQISSIQAGTGARNLIPGALLIECNFRFSTEQTPAALRQRLERLLENHRLNARVDWIEPVGMPFLTESGTLLDAARAAVHQVTGLHPRLSTAGGTSDGRFIAPTGAQVLELGTDHQTIHQVNERVRAADLDQLSAIYENILQRLGTHNSSTASRSS